MAICKFFLQGNCKFGDNCKYEHPRGSGSGGGNRFSALQNVGNRFSGANVARRDSPWSINWNDTQNDVTEGKGRPNWILSTYGPGKNAPASLFEGNEYSVEEIRARFYELSSQGKEVEADQEAIALWNKAVGDVQAVAADIDKIADFLDEASKKHPNRFDFCQADGKKTRDELAQAASANSASTGFGGGGGFGAGSGFSNTASSTNPFSKATPASAFGQNSGGPNFGAAAFGQSGAPSFGQTGFGGSSSGFGTAPGGTFGKPALGPGMGQPAAVGAFGQPVFGSSGFGQPAQPSSAFGQNTQSSAGFGQPAQSSGFGTTGFGQQPAENPFGAASAAGGFGTSSPAFGQSTNSGAFGQQPQAAPAFSQTGFGQKSASNSPFNQPASTGGFGQTSQSGSPFGQPASTGGFGQSAFGKPAFAQSGFGQASQPNAGFGQAVAPPSGFGATNTGFGSNSRLTGFGQNAPSSNGFGVKSAAAEPNDQAMETPVETRPPTRENPFGARDAPSAPGAATSPFTKPTPRAASSAGQPVMNTSSTPHPLTGQPPKTLHYTETLSSERENRKDNTGKLISYRGNAVKYINQATDEYAPTNIVPCYQRPDRKGWERIWFPDGGTGADIIALGKEEKLADVEAAPEAYTDEVKDQYKHLFEHGEFLDGVMPLLPPMHAWTLYDI